MVRKKYDTDLTDEQWTILEPLTRLHQTKRPTIERREMFDALMYLISAGCAWRKLPNDFPSWQSVYYFFCRMKKSGKFEEIMIELNKNVRKKRKGRDAFGLHNRQSNR